MKAPLSALRKRCERCCDLFDLPPVTSRGTAKEIIIQYFPCPHCGFAKDPITQRADARSGRCRDCSIPFAIIDYYANGRCKRCDMRHLRNTTKAR